jgi:Tfp pilus assembly protein PilX
MRTRFAKLARSQEGIALPVTIIILVICAALAALAASAAITGNHQSTRDRSVKRALGAADAGVDLAQYRINKLVEVLTDAKPCVVVDATGRLTTQAIAADGWCPEVSEELGDGATFRYRVSNRSNTVVSGKTYWQQSIVSTGVLGNVQRRLKAVVSAPVDAGFSPFKYGVYSNKDLVLHNTATITGSAGSNGNISIFESAVICGDIFLGGTLTKDRQTSQCPGYGVTKTTEPALSPVKTPRINDIGRFGTTDPWTDPGNIQWSPSTRVLKMFGQSTLTLTGQDYKICQLEMSEGSELIIPDDGTPVRIFIDSPENCGGTNGSVSMINTSEIVNPSGNPTLAQIYLVGSTSKATTAGFYNKRDVSMTLYAPRSTITLDNPNTIRGAVSGDQVAISNSSQILQDSRTTGITLGVPPITDRADWKECTAQPTGSGPADGC